MRPPLISQYMLNLLEKIYDQIKKLYGPRHFVALVVLMFVVSAAGIAIGVKYTRYIRKDPEYCNSCHLMKGVFSEWASSDHKSVACQECHKLTVFEQDALLIKHILYGKTKYRTEPREEAALEIMLRLPLGAEGPGQGGKR